MYNAKRLNPKNKELSLFYLADNYCLLFQVG